MTDVVLSLERAGAAVLGPLLQTPPKGPLPPDGRLTSGSWLHGDPDGQHVVDVDSLPEGGLTLRAAVHQPGGWLALHIALGDVDLSGCALIGFYTRVQAVRACTWKACLRSGTAGGFVDHFFDHDVVAYNVASTHMDMMELARHRTLPRQAEWREFVLFFHVESFETTLLDLRLFSA